MPGKKAVPVRTVHHDNDKNQLFSPSQVQSQPIFQETIFLSDYSAATPRVVSRDLYPVSDSASNDSHSEHQRVDHVDVALARLLDKCRNQSFVRSLSRSRTESRLPVLVMDLHHCRSDCTARPHSHLPVLHFRYVFIPKITVWKKKKTSFQCSSLSARQGRI